MLETPRAATRSTRSAAVYVVITLVFMAAISGTHAHGVGHSETNGPMFTAPGKADSTGPVCLSCQLANSPLEEVGTPATPDPIEPFGVDLSPIDSRLPSALLRRSGGSRAPPRL